MVSKVCFVFMVICCVVLLAAVVYIRDTNNHLFYQLRIYQADHNHLKQLLWQKELRLESCTNPFALREQLADEVDAR
jgi:hypothetical protein